MFWAVMLSSANRILSDTSNTPSTQAGNKANLLIITPLKSMETLPQYLVRYTFSDPIQKVLDPGVLSSDRGTL